MEAIRKRFGPTVALDGVGLTVARGEILALVGENGAGKSTLMKVLSGACRPEGGQTWLDGEPFAPRHPLDARRAGVAMVYQELSLAPHLTVAENVMLGMEPATAGFVRRGDTRRRALDALRQLGHPDIPLEVAVRHLPPGVRQLAEIARALALGCRVLVLDEPTSSLSAPDTVRLFAVLRRLSGQGIAVIYVSHILDEVKSLADRHVVLRDGRVAAEGRTAATSVADIIAAMVGRRITDLYPRAPHTPGEALLEIADLAGERRPESATLVLRRGVVLGIAGLVGAGRTELLRTIFGLDPVRRGRIRLGAYVGPASPAQRWAQGMGLVSEDRRTEGLALGLGVADNLTLTRLGGLGPPGFVLRRRQRGAASRWIEQLNIRCREPDQPVREISGGNQQKVALARLLYHDVEVFLLDEPTRGIDVGSKAEIYRLIGRLAAGDPAAGREPKAVLIVSSHLPELLGVCDAVAVMSRGRLMPARPVEELDEHTLMREAVGAAEVA
jgi:ribose transport system ATP-binding protein